MGNEVYANGREVSCKAAAGKSICAFPDVCMTPPQTPATPPGVPIPYPNTGVASDCTGGSKNVKISGEEVLLKDKSYFKKSTGDEAGSAPMKGVITHTNRGKVYFNSWSMDVKFEGENVVRHLDLTTHNHASVPGDTPTWPYLDQMSMALDHPCVNDVKKEHEACKDYKPHKKDGPDACPPKPAAGKPDTQPEAHALAIEIATKNECLRTRRCMLQPYKPTAKQKGGCCPGQTGHHLIEASAFHVSGRGDPGDRPLFNCSRYDEGKAPSICVEGTNHGVGTHGLMHTFQSAKAMNCPEEVLASPPVLIKERATTVKQAQKDAASAVSQTFPESGCSEACIEAQLSAYHEEQCKMTDPTKIKAVTTCEPDAARLSDAAAQVTERVNAVNASIAAPGVV